MTSTSDSAQLAADDMPVSPNFRRPLALTILIAAALAAVSGWVSAGLPPDARIAIHWNLAGQADGFGGPRMLFLLPGIIAGTGLLLYALPWFEPRRSNLLRSSRAYRVVWLSIVVFLAGLHLFVVRAARSQTAEWRPWVVQLGLGLLFVVMGNYLGKVRSNFIFGVRTPWTLSSELSWNKTHRLAGWLFVVSGIVIGCTAFGRFPVRWMEALLVGWLLLLVAVLSIYSYRVWKGDPSRRTSP